MTLIGFVCRRWSQVFRRSLADQLFAEAAKRATRAGRIADLAAEASLLADGGEEPELALEFIRLRGEAQAEAARAQACLNLALRVAPARAGRLTP